VGNLESECGRQWGYQFSIFRHTPALWLRGKTAIRMPFDLYIGHITITNITEGNCNMRTLLGNSLMEQAHAEESRLDVSLEKWIVEDVG
jgi:predicted secreted hydrolase